MLYIYYPVFDVNIFYASLTLDFVNLFLYFGIMCYLFYRIRKEGKQKMKPMERAEQLNLISWGIFFLILGVGHSINIMHSFLSLAGPINPALEAFFEFFSEKIRMNLLAFLVKIIYVEYVINTYKYYKGYYFSIIFSIVIVFVSLFGLEAVRDPGITHYLLLILMAFGFSILPLLYLYLSIKLSGKSRTNAFKVSVGITVFGVCSLLQPHNIVGYMGISDLMDALIELTYIIGPIGVMISILIIFDSFRKRKQ